MSGATMSMRSHFVMGLGPGGFHRIAYTDWGAEDAPSAVLAVHGLTRNGRDFDRLAAALASDGRTRVVCPDIVGRGRSDWLPSPGQYVYPQYMADMTALIARIGVGIVDWVGTSMGGILGMMMAAQPGTPVRRLVLNDVGPSVPRQALQRIAAYVGQDPRFRSIEALEAWLRQIYAGFGALSDADWRHMALHDHRGLEDGSFGLRYDPRIAGPVRDALRSGLDVDLWSVWEAISCPVLVLRGAESDLLLPDVVARMQERRPAVTVVTFPGVGHAPALMAEDQIAVVRDWLAATA